MSKAFAQISTLLLVLIFASVSLAYDIGSCDSCPYDCDVIYMAVGGDVLVSYSCLTYSWSSGSSCQAVSDSAKCSDYEYKLPECSSKRGKGPDSKCDSTTRPEPSQCYTKVGCVAGEACKNNVCEVLKYGFCEKDDDCFDEEKPFCSKGKCDVLKSDSSSANILQLSFLFFIAAVVLGLTIF